MIVFFLYQGTNFEYSNYGYVLLSALIARASGEDFLSYMHENVFQPLGMLNTIPDQEKDSNIAKSTFYDHATPYSLKWRNCCIAL